MARKTRQSKLSAFKSRYRPSAKALAKKRTQTGPRSKSFKRDYDNSGNKAALPPGWRCVNHRDGSKTWYYETRHNRSDVPGRRRRK